MTLMKKHGRESRLLSLDGPCFSPEYTRILVKVFSPRFGSEGAVDVQYPDA